MTYLLSHNRPAARWKRLVAGVCVILAIAVAAVRYAAPHAFPALFTSVARPFWRTEFAIESGSLQSTNELLRVNEDLKRQLVDADVRLSEISALQAENAELKALLGHASTTPYVLGAVLMRPPFSGYDSLIIDLGADHGLTDGDEVYAPGGVPIGAVSNVLGETSTVTLYSSPGKTYQVLIGPAHAPAAAVGRGGGQYQAQLPRDVKVAAGDFVVAPSLNDGSFGIVSSVITDPTQPFETVLFAPPVNIYQLRWVLLKK